MSTVGYLQVYSSLSRSLDEFLPKGLTGSRNVGRIKDSYAKQKNKLIMVGVLSCLWMERKEGC